MFNIVNCSHLYFFILAINIKQLLFGRVGRDVNNYYVR